MQKLLSTLLIGAILIGCSNTKETSLEEILSGGSAEFKSVLQNPSHEIQIIYGEIIEDSIVHHSFGIEENKFFYPASTVKMPVAFAALKKAEELNISIDDRILIDSTLIYPRNLHYDSVLRDSIRLKSLVEKIFTFSDNTAHNILYGWLGKDYINELYESHGLQTRIIHQLSESAFGFNPKSNDYRRKSRILKSVNDTLSIEEEEQYFSFNREIEGQEKGVGYIDSLGKLVSRPFNFSKKNFVPLKDLLTILEAAVRPGLLDYNPFNFSSETDAFIQASMELLPKDMPHPYDTLPDNYVKFLMAGNDANGSLPPNIQIFNKVGWAYGYLIDVAYIRDIEKDIAFFLAAAIHVNANQIYNDGVYEYEEIGLPFLDELGDLIYAHESSK